MASYTQPAIPDLEVKFKYQQVKLKWSLEEFTESYFGYQLLRSRDGGTNFEPEYTKGGISFYKGGEDHLAELTIWQCLNSLLHHRSLQNLD
jgi:hypothetical protein